MTTSTTQLLLPGQAAAPEGPNDLTMMYVLHHGFRRDLDNFARAAERTASDDQPAWQRLTARWDVFCELLHDHHTKEDEYIWPLLMSKVSAAGDAAALTVLGEMEAEHEEIDPLLESCTEAFVRLAQHPDEDAKASLVVRLARTRQSLGDHLAHEERDAIRILQTYVPGVEWAQLEKTKLRGGMSFAQVKTMVPWAYTGLSPEAVDHLNRTAGPPFVVLHRLTRRKFTRRERAVFGS